MSSKIGYGTQKRSDRDQPTARSGPVDTVNKDRGNGCTPIEFCFPGLGGGCRHILNNLYVLSIITQECLGDDLSVFLHVYVEACKRRKAMSPRKRDVSTVD